MITSILSCVTHYDNFLIYELRGCQGKSAFLATATERHSTESQKQMAHVYFANLNDNVTTFELVCAVTASHQLPVCSLWLRVYVGLCIIKELGLRINANLRDEM